MATNATTKATPSTNAPAVIELGADLSPALKAIETAYRLFQKSFTDAPDVTIVIKRDERAWGHTTIAKVWAPAGEAIPVADRFEIMISGENLRRGAEFVAATLLHEAAHARNLNKGILDTDTNGRHNKIFKCTAEEHGLACECDSWHGWTLTTLTDEGKVRWAKLIKTIATGLAKAAAAATPTIDHLPRSTPKGTEATPPVTLVPGKTGIAVAPPKRGNRNLLKAVCGCGHSIRVSQGVLDAAQPTCQICDQAFEVVGR
jgi:hypothetical protein